MKLNLPGLALATSAALLPAAALAHGTVHQHGVVSLTATLEGEVLSLELEAPMDDLVGFERAPRTAGEKAKAAAALKQLDPGGALWLPNPEAGCSLAATRIDAPVLQGGQPGSDGHADVKAGYEFRCAQPARLTGVRHTLFTAFPRIKRIDFQFALPTGQGKAQLRTPAALLPFKR